MGGRRWPEKRWNGRRPRTDLERYMMRANVRPEEIAVLSGIHYKTVEKLRKDPDYALFSNIQTLLQVSIAMGVAPVELWPWLGKRPSKGLLVSRGVVNTRQETDDDVRNVRGDQDPASGQ